MAKKILIVPDIHGETFWKEPVQKYMDQIDRIIFLGDYLDVIGKLLLIIKRPSKGEIIIDNLSIKRSSHIDNINGLRRRIGFVFQDYNLFENLTVLENLTIGLTQIQKIEKEKSIKMATNILKEIDLLEKKDKYPEELSGGQKQRVAIARTILMKPDIILLDEPTSALDEEMKESVLNLISQLGKEDMTLIIVSHEISFIQKISDKVYKLNKNGLELEKPKKGEKVC